MRLGQSELRENINGALYFIHTSGFQVAHKTVSFYICTSHINSFGTFTIYKLLPGCPVTVL